MIDVKANNDGLHLICERKKETHSEIRSELSVTQGSVGIWFFYDFGIVQKEKCFGQM